MEGSKIQKKLMARKIKLAITINTEHIGIGATGNNKGIVDLGSGDTGQLEHGRNNAQAGRLMGTKILQ